MKCGSDPWALSLRFTDEEIGPVRVNAWFKGTWLFSGWAWTRITAYSSSQSNTLSFLS